MSDHFVSDAAGIAAGAGRVEHNRAMKAARAWHGRWPSRYHVRPPARRYDIWGTGLAGNWRTGNTGYSRFSAQLLLRYRRPYQKTRVSVRNRHLDTGT